MGQGKLYSEYTEEAGVRYMRQADYFSFNLLELFAAWDITGQQSSLQKRQPNGTLRCTVVA